jgi:Zn finger protein HypA/HybF involved in hydrogenase expression
MSIENNDFTEENKEPLIIECPHCHARVIPLQNNLCPACREDIQYVQNTDFQRVAFALHESEELPQYCHSCNTATERLIRISADEESTLETLIFGEKSPESTSNVIIYLPECENCSDLEIELVEVDYDHQMMKIMVHKEFRERIFQFRENKFYSHKKENHMTYKKPSDAELREMLTPMQYKVT